MNINDNDKVAVKIKELRELNNISQQSIASRLGMSNSAYSRLENGEIQITINTVAKLSEVLNVTMVDLLELKAMETNYFNNNQFAQSRGGNINISLTPDEFQKIYSEIKKTEKSK